MQSIHIEIQASGWWLRQKHSDGRERVTRARLESWHELQQVAKQSGGRVLAVHFDPAKSKDRQAAVDFTVSMAQRGWAVCLHRVQKRGGAG